MKNTLDLATTKQAKPTNTANAAAGSEREFYNKTKSIIFAYKPKTKLKMAKKQKKGLLTPEEREKLKAELQKTKSEKETEVKKRTNAFVKRMENGEPMMKI